MKTNFKRLLSLVLVLIVLTAATALTLVSCDNTTATGTEAPASEITITVEVVDDKGESTVFTITTKERYLRGALEQEDLVKGDESEYGLYIKEVNGILADYEVNGAYWGMYKGDEYLMTGVDTTPIADGDHYKLVYTK